MTHKTLIACAATLGALAAPPAAGAADYIATTGPQLQARIDQAETTPADDTIHLTSGDFVGDFRYDPAASAGRLTIDGAGWPYTALRTTDSSGGGTVLRADGTNGDLTLRQVRVIVPDAGYPSRALLVRGTVEQVRVQRAAGDTSAATNGVTLVGASVLRDSTVHVGFAGNGNGNDAVYAAGLPDAGPARIVDSTLVGDKGITGHGATRATRLRITAGSNPGVSGCAQGGTTIESSVITQAGAGPALMGCVAAGALEARHVTITRTAGTVGSPPIDCSAPSAGQATTRLLGVVVATPGPHVGQQVGNGSCRLETRGSLVRTADRTVVDAGPGEATIVDLGGTSDAAPMLTPDLALADDSPGIDLAGTDPIDAALESDTDLGGKPRMTDGDGDGVAARDAGAFERDGIAPPPPPPPAPPVDPGTPPVTPPPPPPPVDRIAPVLSAVRIAPSPVRRAQRPRLRTTLSEAAMLRVTLARLSGTRWRTVATRRIAANRGTVSAALSIRGLRAGAFRARVVAVDAAGNRSATRTARFRIR